MRIYAYKIPSRFFVQSFMYHIRSIQPSDNLQLAHIIRQVSHEFGLAPEAGFAVADSVLDDLYSVYSQTHSHYWVIENDRGQLLGGGGISPLKGEESLLEIQKMYFLPQIRRLGLAQKILQKCFNFAEEHHYNNIYLETTQTLWQAIKLYEKIGFKHLDHPRGYTGHSEACEVRMLIEL